VSGFGENDLAEFAASLAEFRATLHPPATPGEFVAYTDGACFGNPRGNGGWAAAVTEPSTWLLFGHLSSTSNNRAEALGILAALEWVPADSKLVTRSDSELTVRQLQGRYKVKANGDIWELIQRTRLEKRIGLTPEWIRGHAGDPGNELADRLSKLAARRGTIDELDLEAIAEEKPPASELDGVVPRGEWEKSFVSSVRDQLRKGRQLSPKQLAVIERMKNRT
jgi:ribonuclease HI